MENAEIILPDYVGAHPCVRPCTKRCLINRAHTWVRPYEFKETLQFTIHYALRIAHCELTKAYSKS